MKKFSGPLARRYGTALFESLRDLFIDQKNQFELASEKIAILAKVLNKKAILIFKNQTLDFKIKQTCVENMLFILINDKKSNFYKILFDFLSVVIKNQRIDVIQPIFDFYFKLSDKYLDIVRSSIISANNLSAESIKEIESTILKTVQKNVVFSNYVDESLQSGFLVKIGSVDIDASLKSFLLKLQESVH